MKFFQLLCGIIFLTNVFPSFSGQSPVKVLCSIDWFMVTLHPFMLKNDVFVHFSELYMGDGCPANYVQPYAYQFTYRVTECGIRVKVVSQEMVIYSSEIHYASKGTSSKFMIPVSCAAPQHSPWVTMPHHVDLVSEIRVTTTQDDEASYEVFELSQSSQRPICDCPPCVITEHEGTQIANHQVEAQEVNLPFVDVFENWSLRSHVLSTSM